MGQALRSICGASGIAAFFTLCCAGPHLFVDRVNQDAFIRVWASDQEGVGAAGPIKQLPEDDTVDNCGGVEHTQQ